MLTTVVNMLSTIVHMLTMLDSLAQIVLFACALAHTYKRAQLIIF